MSPGRPPPDRHGSPDPNTEIRSYNPNVTVGMSWRERIRSVLSDFRAIKQRTHDKTAISNQSLFGFS